MADSVLTLEPSISYARVVEVTLISNVDSNIANLINPPKGFKAEKPSLAEYNGRIMIMGDPCDVVRGSRYIQDNPKDTYRLFVYESFEEANERYKASYGYDYGTYPLIAGAEDTEQLPEGFVPNRDWLTKDLKTRMLEGLFRPMRYHHLEEDTMGVTSAGFTVETYILNYNSEFDKKAPLLAGHTGIAKSAFVQSIVKELDANKTENASGTGKWGYRLVEIKARS